MTTSRLDPNSTRNPESTPTGPTGPTGSPESHRLQMAGPAGQGGTAPDKPDPAQKKEPPDPAGDALPAKISDWETEGGSPPKVISSTKSTPPKKPGQ